MANREFYDLIIIGGGPGGLTAGIYALRASMRTVLFESAALGGQMTKSDIVENFPGFQTINGFDLSQKFFEHAQSYNLEILSQEVRSVEPGLKSHAILLDSGETLRAHAIVMAMGGEPRKLGIPGEDEFYGKGVSYCAVCDGFFFRDKTVAVVGGGDTAAEEALYLSKLARKVYLIHRRDALRASMILQKRIIADPKIDILWNHVATAIHSEEDQVSSVALNDTQSGQQTTLPVEGVFIFIGFDPRNQLVPAGIKCNGDGYVVTDEKCEVNIPGLFAIGDLREKYARQIATAVGDGCTAALAAAHYVEEKRALEK